MKNNFRLLGFAANLPSFSVTDITLRLDSPGTSSLYTSNSRGTKRKCDNINGVESLENATLALGLGHSPSSSGNSKMSSTTFCTISSARDTTDEDSSVDLDLNFELHQVPKKLSVNTIKELETGSNLDLELSLSTGPSESVIASPVAIIGEESSRWNYGTHLVPSLYPSERTSGFPLKQKIPVKHDQFLESLVACTSGVTHLQQQPQRNSSTRNCQYQGCGKGARGASGLCIAHGGGRRCQKASCDKGAEGRTAYCKAHGGGRRCQHLGCTKSAEGRTDYCIAHGGGRRCSHEGCTRAARGKSGLCIRHGGGKRCQRENCSKSAEGHSGLCISHGGGRRCQYPACTKGAQGSTMFCKAHGGGKRCVVLGCTKGAEGSTAFCKGHGGGKRCSFKDGDGGCLKSVHGGTQFCVAHGGGKRCAVPECTKSARGRTDFCVRHGGGKRCKSEGCGKSAQGTTDFCKAHGGGKRYSWMLGGGSGFDAMMRDLCVHGGGTLVPTMTQFSVPIKCEKVVGEAAAEEDVFPKIENDGMCSPEWSGVDAMRSVYSVISLKSEVPTCLGPLMNASILTQDLHASDHPTNQHLWVQSVSAPEGRVHGGCLIAMLSGSASFENDSRSQAESGHG